LGEVSRFGRFSFLCWRGGSLGQSSGSHFSSVASPFPPRVNARVSNSSALCFPLTLSFCIFFTFQKVQCYLRFSFVSSYWVGSLFFFPVFHFFPLARLVTVPTIPWCLLVGRVCSIQGIPLLPRPRSPFLPVAPCQVPEFLPSRYVKTSFFFSRRSPVAPRLEFSLLVVTS